ncbi:MAG: zinc-finger domain-containing protein [Acidimicrobiales bacterium]|nr:zinc-finger domain-containing protein [Hyphomonadaceae bacterium]RZV40114.1 MAG: zinc-finger domain-containing protein [Acidimicrobiales bacterium]
MAENNKKPAGPEVVETTDHRVSCDGGGGALGHPKVYMEMAQDDSVQCKYCDRVFVLKK